MARSFGAGFLSFSAALALVFETSPFFFLSLLDVEEDDFGFVSLLPPVPEPLPDALLLDAVVAFADEESAPVDEERAGPSSDLARSTEISRPCSSVRCRWLMHSVASLAEAIVTYP